MAFDWRGWLADRFGYYPLKEHFLDRRVGKSPWYYGDGTTLMLLFMVLLITGPLLALSYSPSPETAYQSVRYITQSQLLGWLIRALHYWCAGLMVVMLAVHLLRQILVAGYKFPREGTWLIGVLMLFLGLAMSFTGYALRWDERALYAVQVLVSMVQQVPFIGDRLVYFVLGSGEPGALTLSRLYGLHAVLGPLLLLTLVGFHVYLVVVHGVTSYGERRRPIHSEAEQKAIRQAIKANPETSEVFYPDRAVQSSMMAMTVFGLAVALALWKGPAELYPPANLVAASYPKEEWWFYWYSALIALLPPAIAPTFMWLFPIAVFLVLVALPFLDRSPYRGITRRPVAAGIVATVAIALVALTALRGRSPWTAWPSSVLPPIPAQRVLTQEAQTGRVLFRDYGCNSCHSIGGGPPDVGSDLARLQRRYSQDELRRYVLRPPDGVAMPSYEGRMPEEDLARIVAFVLVAQTFERSIRAGGADGVDR